LTPQHNGAVPAIHVPDAPITLSTASVYPEKVPSAFEIAALLGYDGIEVMVSTDASSQDLNVLRRLSDYHQVPIKSIHAPCLLLTQRVWGREPWGKLVRSKEVAEALGAEVVVVHPPFRWQRDYARGFVTGVRRLCEQTGILISVENMFPWRTPVGELKAYLPSWDPSELDYDDLTLDLSHASTSNQQSLDLVRAWGSRLRHVHLTDGTGSMKDEHLVPGRGDQQADRVLQYLAERDFTGHIILEVNLRRSVTRAQREADLAESLAYARLHFAAPVHPSYEVDRTGVASAL
jgi:sugar phosphate isomerase/epimerase